MKRILASVIILILFVPLFSVLMPSVKTAGSETTIFQDDFESYPVGTFPSAGGWQVVWNGAGDQYQVITDSHSNSLTRSLQLMGSYGWSAVVKKDFSSSSNVIGYEAYMMASPGGGSSIGFFNVAIDTWGRYYALVGFGTDGYINACEKSSEIVHQLQPYTPYTWYKIRVVVDRTARLFNVWIDDVLEGQDIPIYYDPWEILSLQFQVGWVSIQNYFDDAKVFEVSGTPPPAGPVISSVSPITATDLQTIYIYGSGFGNTQPQTVPAYDSDGSVDTVASSTTPCMGISDGGAYPDAWAAGVENASNGVHCLIGIYLTSWSDTEIVLGGFGSALNTNGQGPWNLAPGDPLDVAVFTASGEAHFHINVAPTRFHNIIVFECEPEKTLASLDTSVPIDIGVKNDGNEPENVNIDVLVAGQKIGLLVVNNLQPGESREFIGLNAYWWWTKGYKEGSYQVGAYAEPVTGETQTSDNTEISSKTVTIMDMCGGYCIIVEGSDGDKYQPVFNDDTHYVYNVLLKTGFSADRILCLWHTTYVSAIQWAIETWAMARVNKYEPLLIYFSDHGVENGLCINDGENLNANTLASWLQDLKTKTGALIHVILTACDSGSFIKTLAPIVNLTITSSKDGQDTVFNYWHKSDGTVTGGFFPFSQGFWDAISEGLPVNVAFKRSCNAVKSYNFAETPMLDDDGDGVGDTGSLPRSGSTDGYYAATLDIGHCEWLFPYMSQVVATQCMAWPPTQPVTLWAQIENSSNLRYVRAFMIPPDSAATNESMDLEYFQMSDVGHSGNYSVNIAPNDFMGHASNPATFRFVIIAEQEDNVTSYPQFSDVVFTTTGLPSIDEIPPDLYVTRPLDGREVHETIEINGTMSDNVCLQRAELYVDGNLEQTSVLPNSSESFFQFTFDTALLSNGPHNFLVKCYDSSNNFANQTITLYTINNVHDIAVSNVDSESIVYEGFNTTISATIVNHGSYAENTNLTIYVNSTMIETETLPNLPLDSFATFNFTFDTTSFAYGNYTITATTDSVPGETNTSDNTYAKGTIITIPGDVNGDFTVDIYDAIILAGVYNSHAGGPNWNTNADINGDGNIDIYDAIILAGHFNQHYP